MRRLLLLTATAAALALGLPGPHAHATPVKCAAADITPDGRVFPEPRVSVAFLRFDEFECGVRLLEKTYPDLIQVTVLGKSKGGAPVYDVLVTNEKVPAKNKRKLLIVNSIHGNEPGGREGGARSLEDIVTPTLQGRQPWVTEALKLFVVHFLFPNPDGWINGDVTGSPGAGLSSTRANDGGRDLNRNYPVRGYINTNNGTLDQPESPPVVKLLKQGGWYLGTDNHGQGPDTYGAAGLQIVGQFDFKKSETLARYADAITDAFAEIRGLAEAQALGRATGQDFGAYHWGTLYDMLGYSASGSMIDYYNTHDITNGTGYATELTAGSEVNWLTWPAPLAQIWVDSIRAINFTMLKQAVLPQKFSYPVGGKTAYVFDPAVVSSSDRNGVGPEPGDKSGLFKQQPYRVTRMRFFDDLNRYASRKLARVRVADIASGKVNLGGYDSLVIADNPMPEKADAKRYYAKLREFMVRGGNLMLTDGAFRAIPSLNVLDAADDLISGDMRYVGYVDFVNRTHPLNKGLRGVARQTYDSVPIGFAFPPAGDNCPNWTVSRAAWEAKGGYTAGTNGTGRTIYGELPVGKGRLRILGALLPQPTEEFYHPFGLQNYAVTYTGYSLLQNSLNFRRGGAPAPTAPAAPFAADAVALALTALALAGRRRLAGVRAAIA